MKSLKHYLFIIAISSIPLISLFWTSQMPHTHDGPVHLARQAAYFKALGEGQILPRWASDLNYGYGMPLFNFYYHLPYLLTSFFMLFNVGLVVAFKIVLALSFLLSGVFMFLFTRKFFGDDRKALLATIVYQFSPFHLVDLMVRGDYGETMAFAFLPLVLFYVHTSFQSNHVKRNIAYIGIACSLLLLSHTALSLLFYGVLFLFILFFAPSNRKKIEAFFGLIFGLLLTGFYWIPIIYERKYTYGDLFMKDMYKDHFAPLLHFFIPNITNATSLQTGGIDISFGILATLGLLLIYFIKKSKTVWFALLLIFGSLFFMQPISKFLWENISLLRAFQFPWRFLPITSFAFAILVPTLFHQKKYFLILLCIGIIASVAYWKPPLGYDRIDEQYYWNYPMNTTYFGETDLIWSAGQIGVYPKQQFEIIEGVGTIHSQKKSGIKHEATVTGDTQLRLVDHTQYYPGWRVYVNNQKVPIEFQDQNWRGQITFSVPPGTHTIQVSFGESPIRAITEIISLCALGFLIVLFFI